MKDIFGNEVATPQEKVAEAKEYGNIVFGDSIEIKEKGKDLANLLDGIKDKSVIWEDTPYESLPAGDYLVRVKSIKIKETSNGNEMISIGYEVQDGPHTTRVEFDNLFLRNSWAKTPESAKKSFEINFNVFATALKYAYNVDEEKAVEAAKNLLIKFNSNREEIYIGLEELPTDRPTFKLTIKHSTYVNKDGIEKIDTKYYTSDLD